MITNVFIFVWFSSSSSIEGFFRRHFLKKFRGEVFVESTLALLVSS
jgi:hypothetical protein